MADRIKGITIEINGNTTNLSKSLESVNKEIKDTQSQLRDVEKLLKMDPGNMDLLRQKQQLLTTAVSDTSTKLEALKDAMKSMDNAGVDKTSAEYQALQREIVATESSLKQLQSQAKNSNAELAKIADTAKKVGEGAKKVADSTKGLSTGAAGVLGAIGAMGVKAAANADELNTLSKQTGIATDTLQKFAYASDLIDVSQEDITKSLKKLKKNIASESSDVVEAWDQIGVATRNADGSFRNIEDIFFDTVEALGQVDGELERDTLAMKLFGTGADSLAGILDDGGRALRELGQAAEDKGIIISQEELDQANELNDILDELKATLSGSFGKAAISALKAMAPAIEKVGKVVEKVAGFIAKLSPETITLIATIAAIVAAISPIASIVSGIATAVAAIGPALALLSGPVGIVVAGVAGLAAAGVAIYKNWDAIKGWAADLASSIGEKFSQIKETISGAWENLKQGAAEKWANIKEGISNSLTNIKEGAAEKLEGLKSTFSTAVENIKTSFGNFWGNLKESFSSGFSNLKDIAGNKLKEIKEGFTNKFKEIVDGAKTWGKDIIENFVGGIKEKFDKFKSTVKNLAQTVKDFLGFSEPKEGPLSNAHTFMPDFIDLMSKGLKEGARELQNPLNMLAQKLVPVTPVNVNYNDAGVTSRLDSINSSLLQQTPTQVNVTLQGDARSLFRVVQKENTKAQVLTGKNPLMR